MTPSSTSTPWLAAIGGAVLVTWYGFGRMQGKRRELPGDDLLPDEPERRHRAALALEAEFGAPAEHLHRRHAGGAVVCPSCRTDFHAGVLYCSTCATATVEPEELDDQTPLRGESSQESTRTVGDDLVCVHVAENTWKATLLKGYLETHDIACALGGNMTSALSEFNGPALGEVHLLVQTGDARRARQLLRTIQG